MKQRKFKYIFRIDDFDSLSGVAFDRDIVVTASSLKWAKFKVFFMGGGKYLGRYKSK